MSEEEIHQFLDDLHIAEDELVNSAMNPEKYFEQQMRLIIKNSPNGQSIVVGSFLQHFQQPKSWNQVFMKLGLIPTLGIFWKRRM